MNDHPSSSHAQQLQEAVCERLTKAGALDSIRRKVAEHLRNDAAFDARLQELLLKSVASHDLEELDKKPRGARKNKVEEIKLQLIQQLRGDAQAVLWQALAGPDSDISREVEMRVLEALCSLTEEEQRREAEVREQHRAQRQEEVRRIKERLQQQLEQLNQQHHHHQHPQQQHQQQQHQQHYHHPSQQPHPHHQYHHQPYPNSQPQ